ncbi:fumarylacetoacetate hydrolase family protein [Sandaracinus amylolyticus]|uniref:fumarylacetoacetate hydrolase family protein n=1 Tax=Sandaracinus amylolyticus TaxID=927083 RepID=UPI001F355010|nr:fumarylacetoacetate hydrolase family protein [Sandaracinus amylolyticus]UJR84848.1 Hypothetical protein I5071_69270 [Sandaracinus amylolyticus]
MRATPATMRPLDARGGTTRPLELAPKRVHALGLTYAAHINETGGDGEARVVFDKDAASLLRGDDAVESPSRDALIAAIARLDAALAERVARRFVVLPPLFDYEVELGFVLLDEVRVVQLEQPDFAPPIGYFVANDLSARTVQVLGEGRADRMRFWGAAKSFPGFLVAGPTLWVPETPQADAILDVTLTLTVNGELRQRGRTMDLVATPRELLLAAARAVPSGVLEKGDAVLTGTPSGVAFTVAAWKRALASLLPGRTTRLAAALRAHASNPRMLEPGDVVEIDGGVLGRRRITIV